MLAALWQFCSMLNRAERSAYNSGRNAKGSQRRALARKGVAVIRLAAMLCMVWVLSASVPAVAQQQERDRRQPQPPVFVPPQKPGAAVPPRAPQLERMTPDERRQLRRDITDHGREVYRNRAGQRRR